MSTLGLPAMQNRLADHRSVARAWFGLAVLVLLVAGLLALLLVVARMPPFDRLVTDAGFFRRCLVVHVNLSLVLWFPAFTAGLLMLLPPAGSVGRRVASVTPWLALFGVAALTASAWSPGTRPVMSNYVPMIDDWLFAAGQIAFGLAVLALALSRSLFGGDGRTAWMPVPAAARSGLRAAVVLMVIAVVTLLTSALGTRSGLDVTARYELLFWGFGHVLQVVSVAAMLVCWIVLLAPVVGFSPVGARTGAVLFGLLVAPWLLAPLFVTGGTATGLYRTGFTGLMQFGIFPVVLIVLALCVRALVLARRRGRRVAWRDPRVGGFVFSAGLTLAGFVIGAFIRGSNTMVPAHYHASIGAVTVAFMATGYVMLAPLGLRLPSARAERLAGWQPLLYGTGQLVFALGFGFAGAHGASRKVYGVEQDGRGLFETLGLIVMGIGGLAAILGGVLFLGLVHAAWRGMRAERNAIDVLPLSES